MKIKNKIMMFLMMAMLAVSGLGVSQTVCAAGNISDTIWSFSLSVKNTTMQYTPKRDKTNNSKIYVYWSSTQGGNLSKITVSPFGYKKGSRCAAGTATGGERRSIMNNTGKYVLTNFVYELGCSEATVGMLGNKGAGTAIGKWSPDFSGDGNPEVLSIH